MDNGPKPTRLWHLTGRKHFERTISDRVGDLKWLHPICGRLRRDGTQLLFLTLALGVAGSYAMGKFDPASFTTTTTQENMQPDCTVMTGKKCPHSKPPAPTLPPCPCKEDDKCPMEWMKEEEKNRKRS